MTVLDTARTGDVPARPPRIDWGRAVMVPLGVLLGGTASVRLLGMLRQDAGTGPAQVTSALGGLLTAAFYVLLIRAYLRRGPARATTRVRPVLLAAPVATFLPFVLPYAGSGGSPVALVGFGDLLLLAGFAISFWSLRCLDRSLSVVPQARILVQHGPYARVRHPLYLGELVAMLGLALTLGGALPLLVWTALAALQGYRAVQEEGLLLAALPDYAGYRARTDRIVPGVF